VNHTRAWIAVALALALGCAAGIAAGWWFASAGAARLSEMERRQSQAFSEQAAGTAATRAGIDALSDELKSTAAAQSRQSQRLTAIEDRLDVHDTLLADVVQHLSQGDQARYEQMLRAGTILRESGEPQAAVIEFCRTIAIAPQSYGAYVNRGLAYQDLGKWEQALGDFQTAAQLNPENPVPWNNLAWLKATCPDERYRNGGEALSHAQKAHQLTGENFATLSTLAAAHAEAGDFAAAIQWQEKSISLAPQKIQASLQEKLELYKSNMPLREPAVRVGRDQPALHGSQ
jgi:Flp pilus assembly protein TadD